MANKLNVDSLVKHLIVDGKKPENTVMVYGFVGEGSQEDTWTLYLDPTLQNSIEIKEEDIVHSVSVTRTHTALGGTILWVKNASSYMYKNAAPTEQEALKYFQGDIYQQYVTQNQQTGCNQNSDHSGCKC